MRQKKIIACVIILLVGFYGEIQAQNYQVANLVKNLLKIGYPLERDDVIALDKFGMRFDSKNRINVLEKILRDRDFIHSRQDFDYFIRSEIIIDALHLLDEHDLPAAATLVDEFNKQEGWEIREKALLAYMAAKRDIRYQSNASYLLSVPPQIGSDLERIYSGDAFQAILDIMNCLSYLSDLFVFKGDKDILDSLILFSARTHGFPAEYLSHRFIEMFLIRPRIFISALALKDDRIADGVIRSLIFGIRNNQVRAEVKSVLQKNLFNGDNPDHRKAVFIIEKFENQIDLAVDKTLPKVPELDSHANSSP